MAVTVIIIIIIIHPYPSWLKNLCIFLSSSLEGAAACLPARRVETASFMAQAGPTDRNMIAYKYTNLAIHGIHRQGILWIDSGTKQVV